MALDSVNKIFHGLKNALEKNEKLPNDFSETFLLHCFLNGKSKAQIREQMSGPEIS